MTDVTTSDESKMSPEQALREAEELLKRAHELLEAVSLRQLKLTGRDKAFKRVSDAWILAGEAVELVGHIRNTPGAVGAERRETPRP